jgi:phosphatidylglycerol---prolipoprotein diacylglyceryl transferase
MMNPQILHIYGPFAINSYGLMIVIGLFIFLWLVTRDQRREALLSTEQLSNVCMVGIIAGLLGGRFLYYITEPHSMSSFWQFFALWEGGLSILGAILAILLAVPLYLKREKIPIIPFFDLIAIYAPLLQSIARIGCFFAGCCYGIHTNLPWAVTYMHPHSLAPLCMPLHPTQLYTSLGLLSIFFFMYFYGQKKFKAPGSLLSIYLILTSLNRFFIDFLRADRVFYTFHTDWLSINQQIALCIVFIGCITLILSTRKTQIKVT